VVSDIRPHLEVVGKDGPGHRTFRSGDERSLAAALRQVLIDPRSERRDAKTLREVVLSSYSWDQAVDGTEAAYASFGTVR
jgi:glycosyltransferase involved in cell wall biosynthesis